MKYLDEYRNGALAQQLVGHRPLAGDDVGVVVGGDDGGAAGRAQFVGLRAGGLEVPLHEDDLGAEGAPVEDASVIENQSCFFRGHGVMLSDHLESDRLRSP